VACETLVTTGMALVAGTQFLFGECYFTILPTVVDTAISPLPL